MKNITYFLFCFLACLTVKAQDKLLQSGPMVGYSSMKEVLLWAQTTQSAKVHFVYFAQDKPETKMQTETVETQPQTAFVARIVAKVQPSTKYMYELYINGKPIKRPYPLTFQSQTNWQYRTEPPAFKFLFGSCFFVNEKEVDRSGDSYGGEFEILKAMAGKGADFMLWGGDNTYLREVDFDSRTGIMHRYTHTRSYPDLQPLLGNMHHYATWDDHDYGPNDSDESYNMKHTTLEAFKLFWGNNNYAFPAESVTGSFGWTDVEFFLLDDRWFRTPIGIKSLPNEMFGEKQMRWLIESLKGSKATFKFIVSGGQILNSDASPYLENHIRYREEREKLLKMIQDERINGVVLLTGDRHHTELSKMERYGAYPLHEFTISPITASSSGDRSKDEKNFYRVPETYYGKRNFAVFEVTGERKDRVLTVQVCDVQGNAVWKKEIKASELK